MQGGGATVDANSIMAIGFSICIGAIGIGLGAMMVALADVIRKE